VPLKRRRKCFRKCKVSFSKKRRENLKFAAPGPANVSAEDRKVSPRSGRRFYRSSSVIFLRETNERDLAGDVQPIRFDSSDRATVIAGS